MDMEPRQPPTLPMDLLLEIIARSDDVTTVVRCAAGCKPLRRAMLGPGFLDRLRRRAEAKGGFDPSLLMAVSYRLPAASSTGSDSIVVQPPGRLRFDTDLHPKWWETASSRDGLLVVQRHGILVVCNTITGQVTSLPSTDLRDSISAPSSSREMYQPALLSIDGAGRSFELLVMYKHKGRGNRWGLRTQIFSSQEDKWGAMREINIHDLPNGVGSLMASSSSAPAIIGHNIHWLTQPTNSFTSELIILALHAESAHASMIKLPQELHTRMEFGDGESNPAERFILATTAATVLSLVVAEALVISMWTPVPQVDEGSSISWSRQVVIRRRKIGRLLVSVLDAYQRSGTVLFRMEGTGLVQLNLGTNKALMPWRGSDKAAPTAHALHEINLISVLECMNSF